MDFFKKLAQSEVGQMAMNAARQSVEERIREYADAQQKQSASTSQTSNPKAQSMWPGPVDKTLRFSITTKLSNNFSLAAYGDGHALVYTPTNYIVYFNKNASYIDDLEYLWKEYDESIQQLSNPINLLNDMVPVMLREKEMQSECSPLFFAIIAGFTKYIKEQKEKEGTGFSMSKVNRRGDTPVHVAAQFGSLSLLQSLWDSYFDPLTINHNGETILQAARHRPDITKYINQHVSGEVCNQMILTSQSNQKPDVPNYPRSFESLQEHAIKNNMPHCLFAPTEMLKKAQFSFRDLETVLRILYVQDSNFLGRLYNSKNIFHSFDTFTNEQQKLLLGFANVEMLNAKDSEGLTPMHYIAKSGGLSTFMLLWSYGAEVNEMDNKGIYPMDYALKRDDVDIVKAFLVFDGVCNNPFLADSMKNKKKSTETLQKHYKALEEGKVKTVKFENDNPTHRRCQNFPKLSKDDGIVLSIDGGGMKGILALQLLKEIEKVVGNKFLGWFNHIGGTSTGSMITLGLVKYGNIDHVIRQYFRMKDDIFVGSRPYSGEGLENALLNEFGRDTLKQLGEKKNIRISIPVARVDISPPQLYMFRSYDLKDPTFDQSSLKPAWGAAKVVRASSAAPSFFPPVDGKYMDGGLIANNPAVDILTDCQRLEFERNQKNMSKIIVSIGTGAMQKKIENVDLMKPTTMGGIVNTFNQILHLKDVFIEQLTAADGVTVERARWMAEAMGMAFFRFTPNLEFPVAIDEKDDSALLDAMLGVKYESMTMRNDMLMLASILK
uniref:phospholipase A2 n=1 Tax=Caenorhabditis tropicalis TaxID=1561998 RepID=A0A1I7TJH2_9PELO